MYIFGVVVGIVLVALILVIIRFFSGNKKEELDERQKAIRGVAYKYAYFTMAIATLALCIIKDVFFPQIFDGSTIVLFVFAFIISLLVFACYAIFKDAYLGINQKGARFIVTFILLSAMNIMLFFVNFHGKEEFTRITAFCNLFVGIAVLIIAAMLGIKLYIDKRNDKRDDV